MRLKVYSFEVLKALLTSSVFDTTLPASLQLPLANNFQFKIAQSSEKEKI